MCGEPFYPAIVRQLKINYTNKIFNCYGSTELSPWVFYYKYRPNHNKLINLLGIVPIGKPYKFVSFTKKIRIDFWEAKTFVNGYLNSPNQNKFFVKEFKILQNWRYIY